MQAERTRRQIERAYQVRRNEQQRYDTALRRELEARRLAAYAGRINPSSWGARNLRQAANQASMERARAVAAIRLRDQNLMRSIYGNGVSTVPTREQWLRTSRVNNRAAPNTQSGWLNRGGGAADKSDRWERSPAPERQSRTRASSPPTSDWVAPRPDRRMFEPRSVSGPGWGLVAPRMEVNRRDFDPRPVSGGRTYGEFTKGRRTYSDTFTNNGNRGASVTRSGGRANVTRSDREGGKTDRGTRDAAPTRDKPAREAQTWGDRIMEIDSRRP
ncbi:MAG TPA: hypothetical protein VE732_06205 [Nitrososphaera sp.]|nr:hypothetical protein [Nitrososphaera sp.]